MATNFNGVLTINITPDPQQCHGTHGNCGSSVEKVKQIVRQLIRSDQGSDEFRKVQNVRKVIVKGRWDERELATMPDIMITPDEGRLGIITENPEEEEGGKHAGPATESLDSEDIQQRHSEMFSFSHHDLLSSGVSHFDRLSIQNVAQHDLLSSGISHFDHLSIQDHGHSSLSPAPQDIEANKDKAITYIIRLLKKIKGFEEMTWISELPFSPAVWITVNPETLRSLELDLARPGLRPDDEPASAFSSRGLSELHSLRNLRSLIISGMQQSYQRPIWEGVWCMPFLETLDLRMALEPALRRGISDHWPYIKGSWRMRDPQEVGVQAYHGDDGKGILHSHYGYGEYLDYKAIEKARETVQNFPFALHGPLPRQLRIKKLVLGGFVMDGLALQRCFDLNRLQMLEFSHDCVDAGLVLRKCDRDNIEVVIPPSGPA
ncbi:MAG: hypothetical protein M1823_005798, partial [Watsoniomyces obsoletus]